jgi:hypothetical protein
MKALATRQSAVLAGLLAAATGLLMSGSASANFPGANGRIAFVHLSGALGAVRTFHYEPEGSAPDPAHARPHR